MYHLASQKPVLWVGLGIVAALGIGAFVWLGGNEATQRPTPSVIVIEVPTSTLTDTIEALGTANANESVDITANVTETIQSINFEDGQEVAEGDVIALLDQSEEQAQLEAAKAQQRENERELKRLKTLLANKATSKREYDERVTQREVTKQQIKEMEARIEDRTLRAPFDGVLGIRRLSVGALVQPGGLITTLDDVSQIKLDFTVPALALPDLRAGQAVSVIADAYPDRRFEGIIRTVNSRVDPVTHSVLVRAILPNDDGALRPGLLMRVELLRDKRDTILVPEESIIQRQSSHFLKIVGEDNKVEERTVQIGARQPGVVEITDGLSVGELVIVRGIASVRDGQDVTIQDTWTGLRDSQFSTPAEQ
ncbi:MAG: efflux transporter periplasmic adaptor subunit [Rickettsiales bacterium]|nr:efflux transporter periplasmic adaptor subunit [Rickettsiales bacterium]